ncbi:hypothetical protein ACQY0O_002817 [Thecaphora frezii]
MGVDCAVPPASPPGVRVAIVGSGLTGLVATYLLTLPLAERTSPSASARSTKPPRGLTVDMFERCATLGMDSASISLSLERAADAAARVPTTQGDGGVASRTHCQRGAAMRIDVPMRAFTAGYYPELLALYRHLRVCVRRSNFTYSFAVAPSSAAPRRAKGGAPTSVRGAPAPYLLYNGASGLAGIGIPSTLWRRSSSDGAVAALRRAADLATYLFGLLATVVAYLQLLIVAMWHYHLGHTSDPTHPLSTMTVREFCSDPFPSRPMRRRCAPPWLRLLDAPGRWWWRNVALPLVRRALRPSPRFVRSTVVPLFSGVMTCSAESVMRSPAAEMLEYVASTVARDHYVVRDGVREVVAKLLVRVGRGGKEEEGEGEQEAGSRVYTSAEVRRIERRNGQIYLVVAHLDASGGAGAERVHGGYDHLILATQANQASKLVGWYLSNLESGSAEAPVATRQRLASAVENLARFRYERSVVINHLDTDVLAPHARDWRQLNLVSSAADGDAATMATHLLPTRPGGPRVLQTTNPLVQLPIAEDKTLSVSTFQRVVLDTQGKAARHQFFAQHRGGVRLGPLQGGRVREGKPDTRQPGVWYCGSWATGIPLLEGCVVSARLVCQALLQGEELEWAQGVPWL